MIQRGTRYICDACRKEFFIQEGGENKEWTEAEGWDLCPSCSRAWDNFKESFIERMRKDNGESLV